jgi:hypothetical protein
MKETSFSILGFRGEMLVRLVNPPQVGIDRFMLTC